jgi:hypothetical protein
MKTVLIFGRHFSITSICGLLGMLMIFTTRWIELKWLDITITFVAFLMVVIAVLFEEFRK